MRNDYPTSSHHETIFKLKKAGIKNSPLEATDGLFETWASRLVRVNRKVQRKELSHRAPVEPTRGVYQLF